MANFGDIGNNLALSAGQSVRRNAGGTAFEAFTPTSGTITGATNSTLTVTGTTLGLNLASTNAWTAKQSITLTTEQWRLNYNSTNYANFTVASSGNLTIGNNGGNSQFQFQRGVSNVTPTLAVINTDSGSKACALLSGTNGSAFGFATDSSGFFVIQGETKAAITGGTAGSGSYYLRVNGNGNVGIGSNYNPTQLFDVNGYLLVTSSDVTNTTRDQKIKHLVGTTSAPTIAAGTGAGTSPTVSIAGTDLGGYISVTTGTLPTLSATVATVTFNVAYGVTPRAIVLTPANSNAALLNGVNMVYINQAGITTTTFAITAGTTALTAATAYQWFFQVIQ